MLSYFFIIITLSFSFRPDASHNKLNTLRVNRTIKGGKNNSTQTYHGSGVSSRSHNYPTSSNIVSLNLAHNNISMIEQSFFQTVETVLKVRDMFYKDICQRTN